jgi:hypothetical protein
MEHHGDGDQRLRGSSGKAVRDSTPLASCIRTGRSSWYTSAGFVTETVAESDASELLHLLWRLVSPQKRRLLVGENQSRKTGRKLALDEAG